MSILIEQHNHVILIRLNRPKKLNALNSDVMHALVSAMEQYDRDPSVGCFIITGNKRAFAAGADIGELASKTYLQMYHDDFMRGWDRLAALRTPKIAAVAGYALGGGCELAMMCDLILAAESARFGQPEIKLGLIPGMGGSQRLTKLIGKAKAMDMILTGRMIDAAEAERAGLVARVVSADDLLPEALRTAETIASYGKTAAMFACEAVNRAEELNLSEGILFERRTYYALWATPDAQEGMQAFIEKRTPQFSGR